MDTLRDPPAGLYKYMPAARPSVFSDWCFRFTEPSALNHPFEMRSHIDGFSNPEVVCEIAIRRWRNMHGSNTTP